MTFFHDVKSATPFLKTLTGGREAERERDGSSCWAVIHLWDLVATTTRPLNIKHAWSVHSATGSCVTCACFLWNSTAKMWWRFLVGLVFSSLVASAWFVLSLLAFCCFPHASLIQSWSMWKLCFQEFMQYLWLFPSFQFQLRNSSCVWMRYVLFRIICILVI